MKVILAILLLTQDLVFGFWARSPFGITKTIPKKNNPIEEEQLLSLLEGKFSYIWLYSHPIFTYYHIISYTGNEVQGRGKTTSTESQIQIDKLVSKLESFTLASYTKKNIVKPIQSPLLDGCWKLLYTSSPGTNSPIQRTFTASEKVGIFQVIHLLDTKESFLSIDSETNQPDVSNIVCFGDKARLRVTALASTVSWFDIFHFIIHSLTSSFNYYYCIHWFSLDW